PHCAPFIISIPSLTHFFFLKQRSTPEIYTLSLHDALPILRDERYLYAVPTDGSAELTELYDALNPAPGAQPFEPHITLGLFERAAEAEQVARIVERQHLPMHGRVEELALLKREGEALTT